MGLRNGTWNFHELCSDRKALKICTVLFKNCFVIVGAKKGGSWLILESMYLVVYGLVSLGRVLKVSEDRVG